MSTVKEMVLEGVTIVRHPRDFPARLELADHNLFVHGVRFLLGTFPAIFVLLLPLHMVHGRPISQTAVGFLVAGTAFCSGALMHWMLHVVRARPTPMGTSIGLYSYSIGFQGIVFMFFPVNAVFALLVAAVITFGGFVPLIARYYELKRPSKTRAAIALMAPLMATGALLQIFMPR